MIFIYSNIKDMTSSNAYFVKLLFSARVIIGIALWSRSINLNLIQKSIQKLVFKSMITYIHTII